MDTQNHIVLHGRKPPSITRMQGKKNWPILSTTDGVQYNCKILNIRPAQRNVSLSTEALPNNFQHLNNTTPTYAEIMKHNQSAPNQFAPQQPLGIENQITNLIDSITQFTSTMQNIIQDLMKSQSQIMQALMSKVWTRLKYVIGMQTALTNINK